MFSNQKPTKPASVAALVVTYNRRELLAECLDAILSQGHPVERVIVVDNASTDGTGELFAPGARFDIPAVDYRRMEVNTGGAGGFKEGLRAARDSGCGWCWLMDDDCIARPGTLFELVRAAGEVADERPSFLASTVWGAECEPMNVPVVDVRGTANGYPDWYRALEGGMVEIRCATFVSLLVSMDAVREVGLPIASFFIWGDDTEYTMRLTGHWGPAFLVGASQVVHKRANVQALDVCRETDLGRIRNFRRYFRNNLVATRWHEGRKAAAKLVARDLAKAAGLLGKGPSGLRVRAARAASAILGVFDFLRHAYDLEDLGELLEREGQRGGAR